jgi:glucan biosynthesis protein C
MSHSNQPRPRTYALDNVRTFLTVLVVFHHAALAYGGIGSFQYHSPYHPPGSSIPLTIFNVINQTFFMAMFFLLSGYFSSIAAKKRNRTTFLLEKLKRLGIPTLVYSLLGKGLINAIVAWRVDAASWNGVKDAFMEGVKSTRGAGGPTWYTSLLLLFDTIYTIGCANHFSSASRKKSPSRQPLLTRDERVSPPRQTLQTHHIIIALSLAATLSFLITLRYPFGHIFTPLGLTLGYLPQYILYYCTGIWIQHHSIPLDKIAPSSAKITVGALTFCLFILGAFEVHRTFQQGGDFDDVRNLAAGGMNVFAMLYAAQNEFVGFLLGSLLLWVFHRFVALSNHWTIFGIDVASGSYVTFLIHVPVLVETMTWFDEEAWRKLSPVVKTLVVGGVGLVKSWVLGWGVKWVVEMCGVRGVL